MTELRAIVVIQGLVQAIEPGRVLVDGIWYPSTQVRVIPVERAA